MRSHQLRQGDICRLAAAASAIPVHVLVLSGVAYLASGTGRVVTCAVVPVAPREDYVALHRVRFSDPAGIETIGLAVPDLINWYPASGLSEPIGHVRDMQPVLRLVHSLFS